MQFYSKVLQFIILLFFQIVNDTLDSMLDESGDEEEQNAIVNQVLDEIGIEMRAKADTMPTDVRTNFTCEFVWNSTSFDR